MLTEQGRRFMPVWRKEVRHKRRDADKPIASGHVVTEVGSVESLEEAIQFGLEDKKKHWDCHTDKPRREEFGVAVQPYYRNS